MIDQNDRWYYLRRANAALEMAGRASNPDIARIHREMHAEYLAKAECQSEPRRGPRMIPGRP